ncbi:Protein pygopus [Trichinella sp. T9]|nr:Protein pygopus [Trichinella sp. T9]
MSSNIVVFFVLFTLSAFLSTQVKHRRECLLPFIGISNPKNSDNSSEIQQERNFKFHVTSRCWKFMAKTSPDTVVLSNPFDDTPTKKCTTPTVLVGPMQAKQAPGYMPVNSMAMMMQVENGAPPPLNSLSSLSARVYPSDQPMIFTSSNPNAPPICPCGKCHREIHDNDQAIQCYRGCKFWFHRTCVAEAAIVTTKPLFRKSRRRNFVRHTSLTREHQELIQFAKKKWDEFMVEYERARKANNNSSVIYPPASNTNNTDNHFRNVSILIFFQHWNVADGLDSAMESIEKCPESAEYLLKLKSPKLEYVGRSVACVGDNELVVAIRHRKTKRTVFLPAIMVEFKPQLTADLTTSSSLLLNSPAATKNELIMSLSSQRRTLSMKARQVHRTLHMSGELLNIATEFINTQDSSELNNDGFSVVLPPANLKATCPQEIYNLHDIITAERLEKMDEFLESFFNIPNKEKQAIGCGNFVIMLAEKCQDPIQRRCLFYLSCLFRLAWLYSSKRVVMVEDMEKAALPFSIGSKLLQVYGRSKGRFNKEKLSLSTASRDALIAHIVLLSLALNNFSVPIQDLCTNATLSNSRVRSISRALGCNVIKSNDQQLIVLRQPPKSQSSTLQFEKATVSHK